MKQIILSSIAFFGLASGAIAADKSDTPLGKAYMALLEPMQFAKIVGEECDDWRYDADKAATQTQAFIEGKMDEGVDPGDLASISDYVSYDVIRADFLAWLEANNVAYGDTPALCAAGAGDETLMHYLGKN